MNKITVPLKLNMQGPAVADLQDALQVCIDREALLARNPTECRGFSILLKPERAEQKYSDVTGKLVSIFQEERQLAGSGNVNKATANAINRLLDELSVPVEQQREFVAKGTVRFFDDSSAVGVKVSAFNRDLRSEQELAQSQTNKRGFYEIRYSSRPFLKAERSADLVVKAFATHGSLLAFYFDCRWYAFSGRRHNYLVTEISTQPQLTENLI
jgi:hypothetical protein